MSNQVNCYKFCVHCYILVAKPFLRSLSCYFRMSCIATRQRGGRQEDRKARRRRRCSSSFPCLTTLLKLFMFKDVIITSHSTSSCTPSSMFAKVQQSTKGTFLLSSSVFPGLYWCGRVPQAYHQTLKTPVSLSVCPHSILEQVKAHRLEAWEDEEDEKPVYRNWLGIMDS